MARGSWRLRVKVKKCLWLFHPPPSLPPSEKLENPENFESSALNNPSVEVALLTRKHRARKTHYLSRIHFLCKQSGFSKHAIQFGEAFLGHRVKCPGPCKVVQALIPQIKYSMMSFQRVSRKWCGQMWRFLKHW